MASELNWLNESVLYPEGDDEEKEEADFDQLCLESKASDFYVHVCPCPNKIDTYIVVCPKIYYDKHGHMLDRTPRIKQLLPNIAYGEAREGVLCCSGKEHPVETVRANLITLGFQTSANMSAFLVGSGF